MLYADLFCRKVRFCRQSGYCDQIISVIGEKYLAVYRGKGSRSCKKPVGEGERGEGAYRLESDSDKSQVKNYAM